MKVPIWAQHTTMAGQVSYEHIRLVEDGDLDPDDPDNPDNHEVVWLDREAAQIWAGIDWHDSNERYRAEAGKAALEYLEEEDES